jgi:PHP family Zn ribbon phosphoesterase
MTILSKSDNWDYPGARWWKFDFHLHTPASLDTSVWQKDRGGPNEMTPAKWLLECMSREIDCVAITDHNSGAFIDPLKLAYAELERNQATGFRPLHLFPGVELSVNGGFHLLAIFGGSTTTADIDTLLGRVDYDGTKGNSDGVTRKSAAEVVREIAKSGGLAIPAHVDGVKGLLHCSSDEPKKATIDASTIRQVLETKNIFAAEVINCQSERPSLFVEAKCRWAQVLGSDSHSFDGNTCGSRFTWVKMGSPTFEGLRLALLDGQGVSVRRSDDLEVFDPFAVPENLLKAIEITNARYMGRGSTQTIRFNPALTALIGGARERQINVRTPDAISLRT